MASFTILDGGMGRELKRRGAPFRQPEWSALALIEDPAAVLAVHRSFADAGAQILTTNSYALVPFHIGEERFRTQGQSLADLAGQLARQAAGPGVQVAASLPPLFGSYRPDLFDPDAAAAMLAPLVAGLAPHADLWLAETLSATAEAEAVVTALAGQEQPLWLSFTLDDEAADCAEVARLRSGEAVELAARLALDCRAQALLFNCSQPEVMDAAVKAARRAVAGSDGHIAIGVYANAFPPQPKDAQANDTLLDLRSDLDPEGYLRWVRQWLAAGASVVGGCCGIGPEHIAAIAGLRRES